MDKKKLIDTLKGGYTYQISGLHYEINIQYSKGENELWMQFSQYGDGSFSDYIIYDEFDLDNVERLESALKKLVDMITFKIKNKLLEDLDLED